METPIISVLNRQRRFHVVASELQAFAEKALRAVAKLPAPAALPTEITVVLVTDRKMRRIHRDFMGLDSSTDVITFQHGDIVLSVETAQRQAEEYGSTLVREVRLYLIHGLLHLCGYDDVTPAGYRQMSRLQEELMDRLLRVEPVISGRLLRS